MSEQGDVQMCVTVISVMSGKMDFDVAFRSRTTSAYLSAPAPLHCLCSHERPRTELLHRFGLFVTAASVRRCSEDEALRLKSTVRVGPLS